MKMKLTAVISVLVVTFLSLLIANTSIAQDTRTGGVQSGSVIVATPITPEEAAKKYPMKGSYPMGERDPHKSSGIVNSPYPPHLQFDCSKVAHGGLVVDTHANKVFVRP